MSEALLALEDADLGFPGARVLRGVELRVAPGSFTAVVGDNGSGKSTLLRTLVGVLPPRRGRLRRRPGLRIGYVPQQARLDPLFPLTAAEVVGQGLDRGPGRPRRHGRAEAEQVAAALARVGLADAGPRLFARLSGGQKQRALLARALVLPVDLLLLDEPTAGVDRRAAADIHGLLRARVGSETAVVLVTHHPEALDETACDWWTTADGTVRPGRPGEA